MYQDFLSSDDHANDLFDFVAEKYTDSEASGRYRQIDKLLKLQDIFKDYTLACNIACFLDNPRFQNIQFSMGYDVDQWGYKKFFMYGLSDYKGLKDERANDFRQSSGDFFFINLKDESATDLKTIKWDYRHSYSLLDHFKGEITEAEHNAFRSINGTMKDLIDKPDFPDFYQKVFTKENVFAEFKSAHPSVAAHIEQFYLEREVAGAMDQKAAKKPLKM